MSRPDPAAVPVRPASTVMLLRDGRSGLEVFTLRRAATMVFASGMTVFPGGGVDVRDATAPLPWDGPEPEWWARTWRIGSEEARSRVVAAVREVFEETGVLLAGGRDGTGGVSTGRLARIYDDGPGWDAYREAVTAHRRSMAEVLTETGLPLRADLLRPWSRWITPPGSPRRYDTYFFVAALPPGQRARVLTTEATSGGWHRPAEVLDQWHSGAVTLMPPTVASLTDLAAADSVEEMLATPRAAEPITPEVLSDDGEVLRIRALGQEYQVATGGRRRRGGGPSS